MNNQTFTAAIKRRLEGQPLHEAVNELRASLNLMKLRGKSPDPVLVAIHAAAITLPLSLDELEPGKEIIQQLDDWTKCAQTISEQVKQSITNSDIGVDKGGSYRGDSRQRQMGLMLRLARWRVGASPWPRNMGKAFSPTLNPLAVSRQILKLGTPELSAFALLCTWASQTNTVTEVNAQADVVAGRIAQTNAALAPLWAERLRREYPRIMAGPGQIKLIFSGATLPELISPPLAQAYRSGELNPGLPISPELETELRALLSHSGGLSVNSTVPATTLGVHVAGGNSNLNVPHDLRDQLPFLRWLEDRAALGPHGTREALLKQVKVTSEISPEALVNWVSLTTPGLRDGTPAEKLLSPLLTRTQVKTTSATAMTFQNDALRLALDRLVAGELTLHDLVEETRTGSVYVAAQELPEEQLETLAQIVIRHNELWAWQHHNRCRNDVMDSQYHTPWVRLTEEQLRERAAHYVQLMRERRQKNAEETARAWARLKASA